MDIENKNINEIIESDYDDGSKTNWIARAFSILLVAVGVIVFVKFIPVIIATNDDNNTAEPVDDIVVTSPLIMEEMQKIRG